MIMTDQRAICLISTLIALSSFVNGQASAPMSCLPDEVAGCRVSDCCLPLSPFVLELVKSTCATTCCGVTCAPTSAPTFSPTALPSTAVPTQAPTTAGPSAFPTVSPTSTPTTSSPTVSPTSSSPTVGPTVAPTTSIPSNIPTMQPSFSAPTQSPTTSLPSQAPTTSPSLVPTKLPTRLPSTLPTMSSPTMTPTLSPSTSEPSSSPSRGPTLFPTLLPSKFPTTIPTRSPSTPKPSTAPTSIPSNIPSPYPTQYPTTSHPSLVPTRIPSSFPTLSSPTMHPSQFPTTPRIGCERLQEAFAVGAGNPREILDLECAQSCHIDEDAISSYTKFARSEEEFVVLANATDTLSAPLLHFCCSCTPGACQQLTDVYESPLNCLPNTECHVCSSLAVGVFPPTVSPSLAPTESAAPSLLDCNGFETMKDDVKDTMDNRCASQCNVDLSIIAPLTVFDTINVSITSGDTNITFSTMHYCCACSSGECEELRPVETQDGDLFTFGCTTPEACGICSSIVPPDRTVVPSSAPTRSTISVSTFMSSVITSTATNPVSVLNSRENDDDDDDTDIPIWIPFTLLGLLVIICVYLLIYKPNLCRATPTAHNPSRRSSSTSVGAWDENLESGRESWPMASDGVAHAPSAHESATEIGTPPVKLAPSAVQLATTPWSTSAAAIQDLIDNQFKYESLSSI